MDINEYKENLTKHEFNDLIDMYRNINKDEHPERYELLVKEISLRNEQTAADEHDDNQSVFDAILNGPKDIISAERVVYLVAYYLIFIISLPIAIAVYGYLTGSIDDLFLYLQEPVTIIIMAIDAIVVFFFYMKKMWAVITIVVFRLITLGYLLIFLGERPGGLAILEILLLFTAIRAIHFINTNKDQIQL